MFDSGWHQSEQSHVSTEQRTKDQYQRFNTGHSRRNTQTEIETVVQINPKANSLSAVNFVICSCLLCAFCAHLQPCWVCIHAMYYEQNGMSVLQYTGNLKGNYTHFCGLRRSKNISEHDQLSPRSKHWSARTQICDAIGYKVWSCSADMN